MRAPITDKQLLEMMWERFPEIMKRGVDHLAQQEPNEANELLRKLGLDPEQYRTDGGVINHMKVRAAIQHPDEYQAATQPLYQKLTNCVVCGRLNPKEGLCDHGGEQPAQQEPTDSMGIPMSCVKPLCSPGEHHPLCKLAEKPAHVQQEPVGEWGDGRSDAKRILWKPGYVVAAKVGDKLYTSPPAQRNPLTDEKVSDQQCRRLLYGFMLDFNAVGFEQAGRNLHRAMKEAARGIKE